MNALNKYFRYRQSLIEQFMKGDMSKSEYLVENLNAVLSLKSEPFKKVDSVEKGLFNYQYFNALAKDTKMSAENIYESEKADYYYNKKDQATMKVIELLDFRGVRAYPISVRSKMLKGKLFEIVLDDYNMILHSTNELIRKRLTEEGVFSNEKRKSLIDGYINQRY